MLLFNSNFQTITDITALLKCLKKRLPIIKCKMLMSTHAVQTFLAVKYQSKELIKLLHSCL